MQDSDWDDLRYFLAVGRTGSLSRAAAQLGVNHSTVLRRLASLEQRLGVRLFERLPSGYVPSAAGEDLRARLDPVVEQIESAQRQLSGRDRRLSGTIRITSPDSIAHALLTPALATFRRAHPDIHLQVVITNLFFNLSRREADIAVRPSNTPPENLLGRRIGRVESAPYAARTWISRRRVKAPRWEELDWIGLDESLAHLAQSRWLRANVPEERVVYRVDSFMLALDATRAGLGVALLPTTLAEDDRRLIRLAPPFAEFDTDLWILTHPDLRHVARIRALTDFLHQHLRTNSKVIPSPETLVERRATQAATNQTGGVVIKTKRSL